MTDEAPPILTRDKNILFFYEQVMPRIIQGITVYDKQLMVRIETPGDKSQMIHEIEREYAEGYPNQVYGKLKRNEPVYKRFAEYIEMWRKSQASGIKVEGTPIESWAQVDIRRAALLKHHGVYSVEALAGLSDTGIQAIGMGGRELVQKAKDWLAQAKDAALAMQVQEQNRQLQTRLDSLQEQINELAGAMEELPPDSKAIVQQSIQRRRGRPPKAA